ncbi:MAG TPA: hypothetical protein ENJ43_00565, partial [Gammaproteobacteria bacterium]|nr:hypothetical protein [Gammaproteobacteria bacterium]
MERPPVATANMLNLCTLPVLALVTLLMVPQTVLAASVTLLVVDKTTAEPIEEAAVVLNGGALHGATDEHGKVIFTNVTFPVKVKILAVGYAPVLFPLHPRGKRVKILLTPLVVEGEGLEVVADRVPQKISKITLSQQEVTASPGTQGDALKVIQSLPGVVTVNGGSGMIYVRGSSPESNGVWINTLPVGYLYHWGGLRSTLNPALVEDFNLFLGGFQVEYPDRLGGMLDIRLRAPRNDRLHQQYNIGTFESSLLVEGPIGTPGGTDSFFVAARRSYIDLLLSPDSFNSAIGNSDANDDQVLTVPRFHDAQALWRHELSNGTLEVQYFAAGDDLKMKNSTAQRSDPELAGELLQNTSYQTAGITWNQRWDTTWSSRLALSWSEQRDEISLGTNPDTGLPYFANSKVQSTRLQPEFTWQIGGDEFISGGLELNYTEAPFDLYIPIPPSEDEPYYDFTGAPKHREISSLYATSQALFFKHTRHWNRRLATYLGVRYSRITGTAGIDMAGLAPRLSTEYRLGSDTLLTASWGRYFQMPGGEKLIDGFSTPGLEFTEAEHRIIGIQQRLSPLWALQLEAYHKPMDNLVVRVPGAEPGQNYANAADGESYGIDLLIKRQQRGRRMGWLSYSWGRSIRRNHLAGEEYPSSGDQTHTLTLVWKQPMPGPARAWDWGFRLQAASGKPYTPVIGRTLESLPDGRQRWRPVVGDTNSARLPYYFSLDLRIDRKIPMNGWELGFYLELQNVTQHENVIRYDYGNSY